VLRPSSLLALALIVSSLVVVPDTSAAAPVEIDRAFQAAAAKSVVRAVLTFDHRPSLSEVTRVRAAGVLTHTFSALPMVAVQGPKTAISTLATLPGLRSIYLDKPLHYFLDDSVRFIGADRVRTDLGFNGAGVGVAVIDSGVDAGHADLTLGSVTVQNAKIVAANFFTGQSVVLENQENTDTTSGHGTHVAGTIGGRGTASGGRYTGVAPGSKIIGIGTGEGLNILWALQGFDYAISKKDAYNIKVISNSWGTDGEYSPSNPINVASKEAHDRGITVVFAAGNAGPGQNTLNPYSVAPWVIGVAAGCTTTAGVSDTSVRCPPGTLLANFSSRGIPGDPVYHPTITAPGVWVIATRARTGTAVNAATAGVQAFCAPSDIVQYACLNGTSMATPHISGVAALLLQARPSLTPDLVKRVLTTTATPMTRPDGSLYAEWEVGAGYVDAFRAVEAAQTVEVPPGASYQTYEVTYAWNGTIEPGVKDAGAASHDYYKQPILQDAVRATARVEWTDPVQDIDLFVQGPSGSVVTSSAQGLTTFEQASVTGEFLPKGTYTVDVEGFLTVNAPYEGTLTIEYVLR